MSVNYASSLYFGPVTDASRYVTVARNLPAGDFTWFWVLRFHHLTDPSVATSSAQEYLWVRDAGSTAQNGNDSWMRISPDNAGTTASQRRLAYRISVGGSVLTTALQVQGTTQVSRDKAVAIFLQRTGTTVNLYYCEEGGTAVLDVSATATNTLARNMGNISYGKNGLKNYVQADGMVNAAITTTEMQNIAAGNDPTTAITTGTLTDLLVFSNAATITAAVGSNNGTRSGTWTSQPSPSPILPTSGGVYIRPAEPTPYYPMALSKGRTTRDYIFSGTYSGFTPSTFQAKVVNAGNGTTVIDWTSLTSFSASAGSFSGSLAGIPAGGPYQLLMRDSADTTKSFTGGNGWYVAPVVLTTGQSPMVHFYATYPGYVTITGTLLMTSGPGYEWVKQQTGWPNTSTGIAQAANDFATATGGAPLATIPAAQGGTSSTQWASQTDSLTYVPMLASIDGSRVDNYLLEMWNQGANDTAFTISTIQSNHDAILSHLTSDLLTTRGISFSRNFFGYNRDTAQGAGSRWNVWWAQRDWARNRPEFGTSVFNAIDWADMQTDVEGVAGNCQAATSTTITLAAADDAPTSSVYAGVASITVSGQTRSISAYNSTTKVATISAAWTTIPTAGDPYTISGNSPHPSQVGMLRAATRYAQYIAAHYGWTTDDGIGPDITAATYPHGGAATDITVTVTHRHGTALRTPNGGTTATTVQGFEGTTDGGTTWISPSASSISGASTVSLTFASAVSQVRYLYGTPFLAANQAYTQDTLYDNTGLGLQGGNPVGGTMAPLATSEAPAPSITGSGAGSTAAATGSGSASLVIAGAGAGTTSAASGGGSASLAIAGSGNGSVDGAAGSGAADLTITGSGSGTTASASGSGTATLSGDSDVYPEPSDVRAGVTYGPNGNDYTGTYVGGVTPGSGQCIGSLKLVDATGEVESGTVTFICTRPPDNGTGIGYSSTPKVVTAGDDGLIQEPFPSGGATYMWYRGNDSKKAVAFITAMNDGDTFEIPSGVGTP